MKKTVRASFTLIELMLVVIIIGALVAMVMPRLTGRSEQARVAAAEADIKANIATALKLYELDNNIFMNQFLYRKFYYDKLNHELEFALADVIKSSRNPINKLLKFLKNLLGKKQDG